MLDGIILAVSIGILLMVCYNPHITGEYNPVGNPINQGLMEISNSVTVDGRNLAPVDMVITYNIPLFTGFHTYHISHSYHPDPLGYFQLTL